MSHPITLRADIELGVVPTHIKFAGGLVPDDQGRMPRGADGDLTVVAEMRRLAHLSPVKVASVQVPLFPGVHGDDTNEMITGLRALGLAVHLILMIGDCDPMDPADEDRVVGALVGGLGIAASYDIEQIASTSVEAWMQEGATRRSGRDFSAAVDQNVRVHIRAVREAGALSAGIKHWHIEFLRDGEFRTFTDIKRCWTFVRAANAELGEPFFHVLVDAAHCGDSGLNVLDNERVLAEIAASDEFSMFHASAKTTRGCLSTDDGWVGALLTAAAATGKLKTVFLEVFHHADPALKGLRDLDPRHGIDTTNGRSYREVVTDGLGDIALRLNNLVARGYLTQPHGRWDTETGQHSGLGADRSPTRDP